VKRKAVMRMKSRRNSRRQDIMRPAKKKRRGIGKDWRKLKRRGRWLLRQRRSRHRGWRKRRKSRNRSLAA
jgi:hypothetical protein